MSPSCRRPSLRTLSIIAVTLGLGPTGAAIAVAQGKGKPKPAPAAVTAMPTVSVAGLRVVMPGLGEQGTEIRAFNESSGMALALFVKLSGGGIVEMVSDKSALTSLTDDTGANLLEEARFGPFPKVTKDGSAALIEVEARGRPSQGATSISAEGSIVLRSSSGTTVQKVSGLRLESGKTFKVGAAIVTLGEVTAQGDYAGLTLKLSRSTLLTIKEIRFKDAKGQPISTSRTGSGWSNDDAEVSYQIPAAVKTANLELDVWQNLKEQTVPFNLKFGLSLR